MKSEKNITNTLINWVDWEPVYWAVGAIIVHTVINTGIISKISAKFTKKEQPKTV